MTNTNTTTNAKPSGYNWHFTSWGITRDEYANDPELRAAFDSVRRIMGNVRRSLEDRISIELSQRSRCGGLNDSGNLKLAEIRDRMMFEQDYAEYKAAHQPSDPQPANQASDDRPAPAKKRKYCVTLPDGTEATRTTHRVYTHVIAVKTANGWRAESWAGRPDLAAKTVDRFKSGYSEVAAIPVPDLAR